MIFSSVMNRAIAHMSTIENTKKDYNDNLLKISEAEGNLKTYNDLLKNTRLGYEYLEKLVNNESGKFIKQIEDLVNVGLKAIFFDKDYSVDIKTNDSNESNIILKYFDDNDILIESNIKDVGGGIRTVIGVILQVYFIYHYGAEKIIFIDEGFSQVSSIYIPYLFAFLDEMSAKQELKILLITHDERIIPYANKSYKIHKGKALLVKGGKSSGSGDSTDNLE